MELIVQALEPYREDLEKIAVESTFNWYWLVDGLRERGFPVVLANPAGIEQYSGLKHSDDSSDCFFLAELARLKILPTGYVCPPKLRPIRDLLRRRGLLVRQRTALILSLKSLHARTIGQSLELKTVKAASPAAARQWFKHPADQLAGQVELEVIEQLKEGIESIEQGILAVRDLLACYAVLQSLPGVGIILGQTISLETGEVERFASAGDYASYCRCVDTRRVSNGKNKGQNNGKCGNKYLAWAFVEAANFARRYDEQCRRFYDRKAAQTNGIVATKALACKLAKAAWHIMKENKPFDAERVFGRSSRPDAVKSH